MFENGCFVVFAQNLFGGADTLDRTGGGHIELLRSIRGFGAQSSFHLDLHAAPRGHIESARDAQVHENDRRARLLAAERARRDQATRVVMAVLSAATIAFFFWLSAR